MDDGDGPWREEIVRQNDAQHNGGQDDDNRHHSDVHHNSHDADTDRETQPLQRRRDSPPVKAKYHKHAVYLLVIYIPLLTIPWALTCVLSYRPLTASSFYISTGLSARQLKNFNGWMTAINVLNSTASVITIPVLSALIAQAAAVWSHKYQDGQAFSLEHLVALADRGWTNLATLRGSWGWKGRGSKRVRGFLYLAAIVVLLGSIQQPIYQVLVPMETILVPTCQDSGYMRDAVLDWKDVRCSYKKAPPKIVGWDIEPAEMNRIPHNAVIQKLAADLAVVSLNDVKEHLWINVSNPEADKQALKNLYSESFIASLEQGTTTGVLREHLMRLNSSVACKKIPRSQFPSPCRGEHPFIRSFSHSDNFTRVCVPGKFAVSPWNLTRLPQHLVEEFYLDVLEVVRPPWYADDPDLTSNYTLRCTATTTRGYFELGNYRNNRTWGPLLQTWPNQEEMKTGFNDILPYEGNYRLPTEIANLTLSPLWDNDIFGQMYSDSWTISGPMTMAVMAMFGNKTFFDTAILAWNSTFNTNTTGELPYQQVCNTVPFARLNVEPYPEHRQFPGCYAFAEQRLIWWSIQDLLSKWLLGFNDTQTATQAMSTAVYLANEAVLTMDQWNADYTDRGKGNYNRAGRIIYAGVGASIQKPKLSVVATATISVLLFLQLLGLVLLAWLIYRGPSETRSIDAMTFSRLRTGMEEEKREADS